MRNRLRYVLLGVLSVGMTWISYAASEPVHREFDPEHIERYKNNPDYDYGNKPRFSLIEWLSDLMDSISRWFERKTDFSDMRQGVDYGKGILWVVAILAVVAIIYIIFRGKWGWVFSGKKFKKKKEEYSIYEENIHTINFTDEIELAVQQKNYRKATRLFYLKSLKLLSDSGEIDWKLNKTNTDYKWEIKDKLTRSEFEYLSTMFEYIWYGEFEPTEETFLQTFEKFRSFNNRFQPAATE